MTQRITCRTQFDITATGVRNNFHRNRVPFDTAQGVKIDSDQAWNRARNQQRNWETINQVLSLRALPTDITDPVVIEQDGLRLWQFEFSVEQPGALAVDGDTVGALKQDCVGVPMITGLTENAGVDDALIVGRNITFTCDE
jgi:hypothetical protein